MFKVYWIIAAALGIAVFASSMWYSWSVFLAYQEGHSNERAAAAQYYSDTTKHGPTSCRPVVVESGLIDWLTCLADNISTDGGVKQAEYDLEAQQDMAAWALGMLIATVWLTVITLLGVFFVWRTLGEAKLTTKATQKLYDLEMEPFLSVELVDGHEFRIKDGVLGRVGSDGFHQEDLQIRLVNNGRVAAIATGIQRVWKATDVGVEPSRSTAKAKLTNLPVGPNAASPAISSRYTGVEPKANEWTHFFGYVDFRNHAGTKSGRFGFCFLYNPRQEKSGFRVALPRKEKEHWYYEKAQVKP